MQTRCALAVFLAGCSGGQGTGHTGAPSTGECELGVVCTIAGVGVATFNAFEGDPLEVGLFWPSSVALDHEERLVIVDYNSNLIRRIDDDGVLRSIAGNGAHAYAMDGAAARETPLENPSDIVYAHDGTAFMYETHGARILKIDPTGWLTIHGGDPVNPGYDKCEPEGVPAREGGMTQGWGVTLGDDGTVYFAEPLVDRIRKITPDGIMASVAGECDPTLYHLGAGLVDGVGVQARFRTPFGVDFHDGFLYVADSGNHAIRRIDVATDEVVTIAGTGTPGLSGDGGPGVDAQLNGPMGLDVDAATGAIFVADTGNNVVRRIDPDGTIETVVGTGEAAYGGDGGPPLEAMFSAPQDVLVLPNGDLVVVDTYNARIRLVPGLAAPE